MVAIEQGGTSETAIDGISETINSMIKSSYSLVADQFPSEKYLRNSCILIKTLDTGEGET
jgi:hypothetical protein